MESDIFESDREKIFVIPYDLSHNLSDLPYFGIVDVLKGVPPVAHFVEARSLWKHIGTVYYKSTLSGNSMILCVEKK